MEHFSDTNSEVSISECTSCGATYNTEGASLLDLERDHGWIRCDQNFFEMNTEIC